MTETHTSIGPTALAEESSKAPDPSTTDEYITANNLVQCRRTAIPTVPAANRV